MILLYALKLLQKLLVLVISYSHQNIIDYAESKGNQDWWSKVKITNFNDEK